jgi:hypothetical protein
MDSRTSLTVAPSPQSGFHHLAHLFQGGGPNVTRVKLKGTSNICHFVHLPPMDSTTDCDLVVDVLFGAIESKSEKVFKTRRPSIREFSKVRYPHEVKHAIFFVAGKSASPRDSPWLGEACTLRKPLFKSVGVRGLVPALSGPRRGVSIEATGA